MKMFKGLAVLLVGAALSVQSNAATYTFSGQLPGSPDQTDFTATFSLSLPDFVFSNTLVPVAEMSSCTTHFMPCESVTFHIDAAADGLTQDLGVQAIEFSTVDGFGWYFYFEAPAFTTPGSYASIYNFNPGTLIVAVPEPSTYSSLLLGIALTGAAVMRTRRKAKHASQEESA